MIKRLMIILIRLYQITLSPFLGKNCRFEPTCSKYAMIAIEKYGIITGMHLFVKRVLRCHPWGGCGDDPVP